MSGLRRIHEVIAAAEQAIAVADEHRKEARRIIGQATAAGNGDGDQAGDPGQLPADGGAQ